MFDITKLTLGEVAKVEELSGQSIRTFDDDEKPMGKMLAALAFVIRRRQQMAEGQPPSFTWNEALDLEVDQANTILGITDEEEDTDEAGELVDPPKPGDENGSAS